ncbi:MAG TPA: hypothetical protein VNH64_11500, partial [Parvularculaceae bacterium]|nr:hypothetical protein [Parvularculaceae bacterium]
ETPKPKPAEPKPVIDLIPKPAFAPPRDENEAPTVGEAQAPAPQPEESLAPPAPEPAQSEKLAVEQQSPSAAKAGLDVAPEAQNEKKAEVAAGEENPEKKKKEGEAAASGDDQFDSNPFGPSPSRMALPAVDLPEGVKEQGGGKSGVVAIFCPEQFKNKDKAAECAGRTQILSGWKPGSSGEDWSKAIALLKADRAAGKSGSDIEKVVGPEAARRIKDAENVKGLTDFRRNADKTPGAPNEDNLTAGWGRPNIGPQPFNPNWTLRDDPLVTNKDVSKLGKDLDAANAAKKATSSPDDDADKKKKPK